MTVSLLLENNMSLRKALCHVGCSRNAYYYRHRKRSAIPPDPAVASAAEKIMLQRPSYGTRRVAVMLSRYLGRPVNRKQVQRLFHIMNWTEPAKKKGEIIRSKSNIVKASRPHEFWEADMSYIWCGADGWCYLFNVLDVFTREWVSFALDISAVRTNAIQSVVNAVSSHDIDTGKLNLRVDNGSQYASADFRSSMKVLGIRLEYIFRNTPEQNGHIESFHKTLKREYIWPYDFQNYQEAEIAIGKAFLDYNKYRIHSALGYMTPYEFLETWEMKNK